MFYDSAMARQLSLFGEGQKITDTDMALIVDRAHRMRAVAIAALLQDVIDAVRRQYRAYITGRSLSSLSDHILRDIGIERDQIPTIARRAARGMDVATVVAPAATAEVLDIALQGKVEGQSELPLAA